MLQVEPNKRLERALDALLDFTSPAGTTGRFLVEVKQTLEPKDIPRTLSGLVETGEIGQPLVVSRFLSPRVRDLLRAAGASFADTTGNVRVVLEHPALFVETTGKAKNPWREKRGLVSLKGRSAARVVRALLDFTPPVSISELSKRSKAGIATVSRVVDRSDH